jgi:hypothetical protein
MARQCSLMFGYLIFAEKPILKTCKVILSLKPSIAFVLICCWLRGVALSERSLWLPVCCVTRITHSAFSRPEGQGRRYTNPNFILLLFFFLTGRRSQGGCVQGRVPNGVLKKNAVLNPQTFLPCLPRFLWYLAKTIWDPPSCCPDVKEKVPLLVTVTLDRCRTENSDYLALDRWYRE